VNPDPRQFPAGFRALTTFPPLRWQTRLFEMLVAGDIPEACDLPTGLGKTSIIPIWLLALAGQASRPDGPVLPRRLVYIVDRRTVVDQATTLVRGIRERLLDPDRPDWQEHTATLHAIRAQLTDLCATTSEPLAVSTLRGELADNGEWKVDPARPAIVIGTVDMIGSRLLFSGYGDGRYGRAHHAGLLGQDALIVHDESHLSPAFTAVLRSVENEQRREHERALAAGFPTRPVRVLDLSATARDRHGGGIRLALTGEDELDPIVRARLDAAKWLRLHSVETGADARLPGLLADLALQHDGDAVKVLVYVRNPQTALQVAGTITRRLGKGSDERVALLTGTIRGHERDLLVSTHPVYQAFLDPERSVLQTVYLVSTSAGEVGIDIDADHMVCDLTTLDALIQRLGRVNRRGGAGRTAYVDLVLARSGKDSAGSPVAAAVDATAEILESWQTGSGRPILVGPRALSALVNSTDPDLRRRAFSPEPGIPPLTDILLDNWSLTSVRKVPGRPEVASYLHGLAYDPPETTVAWRHEVALLAKYGVDSGSLRAWFRACRVESRELVRDRTDRVATFLADLLQAHRRRGEVEDFHVVLLDERGDAEFRTLSELAAAKDGLAYRTVVLPTSAGGLAPSGMLDPSAIGADAASNDVAEIDAGRVKRRRFLERIGPDGQDVQPLCPHSSADARSGELHERARITLFSGMGEAGEEHVDLVLLTSAAESARENPETAAVEQTLTEHTAAAVDSMARICCKLAMPAVAREALERAAAAHDRGKERPVWQRYARNPAGREPLAKARRYLHPRALGGYRHEFGSLIESMALPDLPADVLSRDLFHHLVAAHHGNARPHFEPQAMDGEHTTTQNRDAALGAMQRFARLQHALGRWGLAWLESLLRCADIAASQITATESSLREEMEARP